MSDVASVFASSLTSPLHPRCRLAVPAAVPAPGPVVVAAAAAAGAAAPAAAEEPKAQRWG